MLNEYVCAPISLDVYRELLNRHPENPHTVIQNVLHDFLDRTSEDHLGTHSGFNWDRTWLPDGTRIRTKYFGEYLEAQVKSGKLVWNGEEYDSIAKLINKMRGGTNNNAWKVAELKRPNDTSWRTAMKLRV